MVLFLSRDHRENLPSSSYQSEPSRLVQASGSTKSTYLLSMLKNSKYFLNLFISCMIDPAVRTFLGVETIFCATDNVFVLLHKLQDTLIAWLVVVLEITSDNFTDIFCRSLYLWNFSFKKDNLRDRKRKIPKLGEMSHWLDPALL